MYLTRVPFWTLVEDPWTVIDPLLSEAPDVTAKLTPVCRALGVDKNELAAKRAMATYTRLTSSAVAIGSNNSVDATATSIQASSGSSAGNGNNVHGSPCDTTLATAMESVRAIACPLRRVRVWAWMGATERNRNDELALRWVLHGLEEINGYKRFLKSRMKGEQLLAVQGMSYHIVSFRRCHHHHHHHHHSFPPLTVDPGSIEREESTVEEMMAIRYVVTAHSTTHPCSPNPLLIHSLTFTAFPIASSASCLRRDTLTADLTHLRCEKALKRLDVATRQLFSTYSPGLALALVPSAGDGEDNQRSLLAPSFVQHLCPHIDDPATLLRKAFMLTIETAWDGRFCSLRGFGQEALCTADIIGFQSQAEIPPTVLSFLHNCGATMAEIALRCAHIWTSSTTSPTSSDPSVGGVKSQSSSSGGGAQGGAGLELLRHEMIGKMLADVGDLYSSSSTSTNGMAGPGIGAAGLGMSSTLPTPSTNNPSHSRSLASHVTSSLGHGGGALSAWGLEGDSTLRASSAESKREAQLMKLYPQYNDNPALHIPFLPSTFANPTLIPLCSAAA